MLKQLDVLQFEYIKDETFEEDVKRLENEIKRFDNSHKKIDFPYLDENSNKPAVKEEEIDFEKFIIETAEFIEKAREKITNKKIIQETLEDENEELEHKSESDGESENDYDDDD